MAYANDPSGGRTGPYWRRQLGATLPGERTAAELAQINALRRKQGLPAEGGPVGDNTRFASQGSDLRTQILQHVLRHVIGQVPSEGPALEGGPTFNQGLDPVTGQLLDQGAQAAPVSNDQEDLRQKLLSRFQGSAPMLTSRDALRQYVQQHMQRRAAPGPQRPILPQRQPQRAARRALPY